MDKMALLKSALSSRKKTSLPVDAPGEESAEATIPMKKAKKPVKRGFFQKAKTRGA